MKRLISFILSLVLLISLSACGKNGAESDTTSVVKNTETTEKTVVTAEQNVAYDTSSIDVDLTQLSGTMVYSQVYDMLSNPDNYLRKTVKMNGNFSIYQDESTGAIYYACIIADATACCSQGLEFLLKGDYTYPNDFPELGSEITVTGVFETYTEGQYQYCRLRNAVLEV